MTTLKDTNKLQNLIAKRKFVVNVSETTGKAYFCEILNEPNPPVSKLSSPTATESYANMETKKVNTLAKIRNQHPRAYEKWTETEGSELSKNYREGLSISQLAEMPKTKERNPLDSENSVYRNRGNEF